MRRLGKVDWLGGTVGFLGTMAVFALTGTGESHNDMFTLLGVTGLAGLTGLIGGPVVVWRRWRRQSLF